jgi:formylglycine-generating enzyme required for sulfatase activity
MAVCLSRSFRILAICCLYLSGVFCLAPSFAQSMPKTPLVNSIGMEFVLIPAGTFNMGAEGQEVDERPVHQVTITQPFYLGKYEVTQAQWQAVMGKNPYRSRMGICRPSRFNNRL